MGKENKNHGCGNHAAAHASYRDTDVAAIYPITFFTQLGGSYG